MQGGKDYHCQARGRAEQHQGSFNTADFTWLPGCRGSPSTSAFCSKESQGSPASGPPGSALPRRRLWCCSGASSLLSNPSSTTSTCTPLSDLRESLSIYNGDTEGWHPASILPTGWVGQRFTFTCLLVNAAGRPSNLGLPYLTPPPSL